MENKKTQELVDILEVQGVKARGFGVIPKIVMQDTRLSVTAKAIYSYLCSFAGAGSQAFPGVKKICVDLGITNDTFLKHRKQLEQYGYIIVKNVRDEGRFSRNIYVIVEKPENTEFPPCPKKTDTVKNRHGEKPYRKNHDTNINSNIKINNNNKNNNGVAEIISIFSEQGINIKPVIRKNPEVFAGFTERDIRLIAETLAKKQVKGKILNPVGMLLSDPRAVAGAILAGKFYPSKKTTTTTKYDDAEIYVPPPGIY